MIYVKQLIQCHQSNQLIDLYLQSTKKLNLIITKSGLRQILMNYLDDRKFSDQ